jgi:GNAT superfamily N-acetyltransferase
LTVQFDPLVFEGIKARGYAELFGGSPRQMHSALIWSPDIQATQVPLKVCRVAGVSVAKALPSDDFGALFVQAYGMHRGFAPYLDALLDRPNWLCAVARVDGALAGAALSFECDGYAWLVATGVLAPYRGRGAHRALLAYRAAAAGKRGCKIAIMGTLR